MSLESKVDQLEQLVLSLNGEVELLHKAIDDFPIYRFALTDETQVQFVPKKANKTDTGWDVRAYLGVGENLMLQPGDTAKIPLGFRSYCPDGYWFQLVPRSSTFTKKSLHCLYGTVDETYEGNVMLAVKYMPDDKMPLVIEHGEAIAQIIPVKRQEMYAANITNVDMDEMYKNRNASRGAGGFGSSGK